MIEKIYTVYAGELVEIPVEREGPKMVFIECRKEMGFNVRFNKEHVCVTPAEAIQEGKNRVLTRIGMHEDVLAKAKAELKQVLELETGQEENK